MRVTREQAAANRERVVETAARLFRERGIAGVGVAELMKAAGLTHGGFYGQFASKDELVAEACSLALAESAAVWNRLAAERPDAPLAAVVGPYLSDAHVERAGGGCVYAALASEAARHPHGALRRAFTEGLQPLLDVLARLLPLRSAVSSREAALAAMAQMVGAVVLARAVDSKELAEEILAAARAGLIGEERPG